MSKRSDQPPQEFRSFKLKPVTTLLSGTHTLTLDVLGEVFACARDLHMSK